MARVTVEDCVDKVPNRFDLVIKAAQRARQISVGAQPTIECDNDKNPVIALREIAESTVDLTSLEEATLVAFRRQFMNTDSDQENNLASPELTLSGDIDDSESTLEAEFEALEQGMHLTDETDEAESDDLDVKNLDEIEDIAADIEDIAEVDDLEDELED